MLLIPIAQEESTVRRLPYVSLALIALNAVFFTLSAVLFDANETLARVRIIGRQITEHLAARPYLQVPQEVAPFLEDEFLEALRDARASMPGEPPPSLREADQARLDELGREMAAALDQLPARRFGYVPARPDVARALTSMFVHAGWMHLIGNMLFLFLSAPFIEDRYGRPVFAVLYFLSGFAAVNVHTAMHPGSLAPLVGASGAIAGVMGAFLVRLGTSRIRFLFLPIPVIPAIRFNLVLPAFVVLPLWFGEQILYARIAPDAGVAFWAHAGGFAFGMLFAGCLLLARVEEAWIHPTIEKDIGIEQHPAVERASEARARAEWDVARAEIEEATRREPGNLDAWRLAYEIALETDDAEGAGRAGGRLLDLYAKAGEERLALDLVLESKREFAGRLPMRYAMAVGAFLEAQGDARTALEVYDDIVRRGGTEPLAFRALLRSAEILRSAGDGRKARAAYERARAHPGCTASGQKAVEQALATLA